jgi:hypothetical protein
MVPEPLEASYSCPFTQVDMRCIVLSPKVDKKIFYIKSFFFFSKKKNLNLIFLGAGVESIISFVLMKFNPLPFLFLINFSNIQLWNECGGQTKNSVSSPHGVP